MKSSYQHYLEEERPHKAKRIVESRKRKADLQSGLDELRAKKKRVEKTIRDLVKSLVNLLSKQRPWIVCL